MTTYTLHVPTWRRASQDFREVGPSLMGNQKGYLCCLGQFAQPFVNVDLTKVGNYHSLCDPQELADYVNNAYDPLFVHKDDDGTYINTDLSKSLVSINDADDLSDEERVNKIRWHLERLGHELIVEDPEGELSC